ncbi:Bromo domain-containing protein, partial [Psidium guajava]
TKLVVKLNQKARGGRPSGSEDDESEGRRVVKKRRINGGDEDEDEDRGGYDEEERKGCEESSRVRHESSPPGTPSDTSSIPLPDKKTLQLILDKLQKKDTYGVYAEPVDPDELPDYHDVIENPMDFSTVRKKLADGSYAMLDQFESDVFLICLNAMRYNAPDTIYHKQARAIEELGRKKFSKLKIKFRRSEKELKAEREARIRFESHETDLKSEQKTKSNYLAKKQIKKPVSRSLQEPVDSDLSVGATLATPGDVEMGSVPKKLGVSERPNDGPADDSTLLAENNLEKAEEAFIGKSSSSKLGRKPSAIDENRRTTYSISNQPEARSESVFTTFEGEIRQLVAVGLHADYSHARSLARFAATLGPIAWKVASQRIEGSLPAGCEFGRGWVGEYEPLPTPVVLPGNCFNKDLLHSVIKKHDLPCKASASVKENAIRTSASELRQPSVFQSNLSTVLSSAQSSSAVTTNHQTQGPVCRNPNDPETKVVKQFELNSLPSPRQNNNATYVAERKVSDNSQMAASRSREILSRNLNNPRPYLSEPSSSRSREMVPRSVKHPQLMHFRQLDANGFVDGRLPNGELPNNISDRSKMTTISNGFANKMPMATPFTPDKDRGLSDSVQLMRRLSENAQEKHISLSASSVESPSIKASVPTLRMGSSGNVAAAAWMSVGAGGLKQTVDSSNTQKSKVTNQSTEELHPQMAHSHSELPVSFGIQFQADKNNNPFRSFVLPSFTLSGERQSHLRPMIPPQIMTADSSRFPGQLHWRGIAPHTQPRQKQETLPPDLNIGFQSPKSPAKQSSSVVIDSQQPDLALQL